MEPDYRKKIHASPVSGPTRSTEQRAIGSEAATRNQAPPEGVTDMSSGLFAAARKILRQPDISMSGGEISLGRVRYRAESILANEDLLTPPLTENERAELDRIASAPREDDLEFLNTLLRLESAFALACSDQGSFGGPTRIFSSHGCWFSSLSRQYPLHDGCEGLSFSVVQ
jgi:hypothetical protein